MSDTNSQDFIEYATKLGYDRRLAEIALQRLGSGARKNDLLKCVINLQKETTYRKTPY